MNSFATCAQARSAKLASRESKIKLDQCAECTVTFYEKNTVIQKYWSLYTRDSDSHTQLSTAALFPTARRCKHPNCPSTDERVNKLWQIHMVEYCSAPKRSRVLRHATTWVSLGNIVLSEISQIHKHEYCMILLT